MGYDGYSASRHDLDLKLHQDAAGPGERVLAADRGCTLGDFQAPEIVAELSVLTTDDWSPHIARDGLTFLMGSFRSGGLGDNDLWIATRGQLTDPFSAPVNLTATNSAYYESGPCLSPDGLTLVFSSKRPGGAGDFDLWTASRDTSADAFGPPANLSTLNTSSDDGGCGFSGDGATLIFTSSRPGGVGKEDLWQATVQGPGSFAEVKLLAGVNTSADEGGGELSADGLELYFNSNRPGGQGGSDLYVARRASPAAAFEAPVNLTMLNTSSDDVYATVSADGRAVYYNRDAVLTDTSGKRANIWLSRRGCGP